MVPARFARHLLTALGAVFCIASASAAGDAETIAGRHFKAGVAAHDHGNLAEAEAHYISALRLDSELVSAAVNLAIVYEKWHRDDLALKYYNEAARVAPRSFAARYNRGQFLQKRGEYDAARADYTVALKIRPDEASLFVNLAAMEIKMFEQKQEIALIAAAEKNLKQAERLKSKSPALYFNRARLYELNNFPARARTAYHEAMRYYSDTSPEYQTCQLRAERLSRQLR